MFLSSVVQLSLCTTQTHCPVSSAVLHSAHLYFYFSPIEQRILMLINILRLLKLNLFFDIS